MRWKVNCLALSLSFGFAASEAVADQSKLSQKAKAVRATSGEMNFIKLPWVTNLFEGFKAAKKEQRPVFLYLITGDPLDDC